MADESPKKQTFKAHLKTKIDYQFWGRMPGWSVSEAAALLVNLNPDDTITFPSSTNEGRPTNYVQLLRILERATVMKDIDDPARPEDFLHWAKDNKFEVPLLLKETVKSGVKRPNWRAKYFSMKKKRDALKEDRDHELLPKERTTYHIIIYAIACKHFGYLKTPHNSTSLICKVVEDNFLKIGNGTVKKVLDASLLTAMEKQNRNSE